jgi:vacuolar-type H+-ATPase subunit I/STV1
MSTFCQSLLDNLQKKKFPFKNQMMKSLKKVIEDDIKAKKLFEKKLNYLSEKKQKALESRRNTINRKKRKRVSEEVSRASQNNKRMRIH